MTPGSGTERLVFQVSVLREIFEVKNREMQLSLSSSKKVRNTSSPCAISFFFQFFQSPNGQQGINVKKVEDLANKLGSKFSLLSRNMTQNIQTMSDKLGESGMNLADKVRTATQRPDSRVSSNNTVSNRYVHFNKMILCYML